MGHVGPGGGQRRCESVNCVRTMHEGVGVCEGWYELGGVHSGVRLGGSQGWASPFGLLSDADTF